MIKIAQIAAGTILLVTMLHIVTIVIRPARCVAILAITVHNVDDFKKRNVVHLHKEALTYGNTHRHIE